MSKILNSLELCFLSSSWCDLSIKKVDIRRLNAWNVYSMLLQATIIRNYFVKTQMSVASFGPPDLSIIFSNGMYLEVSPL